MAYPGKRFIVDVSDELHRRVRIAAAEDDISISEFVRVAIERALEQRQGGGEQQHRKPPRKGRAAA
jgi:hypothetical protein